MTEAGKPQGWQQWIVGIVALLIASGIGGGVSSYVTTLLNEKKIADVSVQVTELRGDVKALAISVNKTEQTATNVKTTLDEGIRQSLSSHDRRITQQEEFNRRLGEILSELRVSVSTMQAQLELMRRTSEIDLKSSPGRR